MTKSGRIKAASPAVLLSAAALLMLSAPAISATKHAATTKHAASKTKTKEKLVPIPLVLPKPAFQGTPKNPPPGMVVEKPLGHARPPFLAPAGVTNVALGKPVTGSDPNPIIGSLSFVTDGAKGATEGNWVEMGPGVQWVQIDLKKKYKIYAIVVWHYHGEARIYKDVVVQVADDPDFITNVRTLFNNDQENADGLGIGHNMQYFETNEGKLIDAKGVTARYVRLYSKGSTADDQNDYTEVEVYGK